MRRLFDSFTLIALMLIMSFLQQLAIPGFTGFAIMITYWIIFWWWFDGTYIHISNIKVKDDNDNNSSTN